MMPVAAVEGTGSCLRTGGLFAEENRLRFESSMHNINI